MKIAILSFYTGFYERGVESWAENVSKKLSDSNSVTIFQSRETKGNPKINRFVTGTKIDTHKKESIGTIPRRFFIDYWSLLIAKFTISVIPHLIKNHYDVIIPTNGGWQSAIIRIITWFKGEKMVVFGHSGIGWDERNNLWCFPDLFIALSSKAKIWAKRANPFLSNIEYVPNGVDLVTFSKEGKKAKINLLKPIILSVSALSSQKRLDLVIKAVSKMKNASLLILGRGEEQKKLEVLGESLLGKRFEIRSVSYSEIPDYYRASDLFTLASPSYEAFGLVFLEALASNLPVVAPDDPQRREIVGKSGLYVNPEDIENYAKTLTLALNSKWDNTPRLQAEKFSWDKIVNRYQELFKSLNK